MTEQPTSESPHARTSILSWLSEIFAIDVRSLAAFRIGIAILLLVDLGRRSLHLVAHYTDYGLFPRSAWDTFCATADNQGARYWWSLHRLSGEPWWEALLFVVAAAFALLLLVGYRTRLTTVASWILLASLQSRNPLVDCAGDDVLRCLLFWAMFLPLGAAASVDRLLWPVTHARPQRILSAASAALLVQLAAVYLFAAALKSNGTCWTTERSALYYALNLDMFTTPLGRWLLNFPALLRFLTTATYWLEWLGPLAVFSPVFRAPLRTLVVLSFWSLHLGLALTLHLGIFPWVMIVAWLLFIPGGCWDVAAGVTHRRWGEASLRQLSNLASALSKSRWFRWPADPCWRIGPWQQVVVSLLLAYVVAWNTWNLCTDYLRPLPALNVAGHLTRLNQYWSMFAPCPGQEDGWYVMRGVLDEGSQVNLWQPGAPLPWDKPRDVFSIYGNDHDRQLLANLWARRMSPLRRFLADWLRWRWNREFAGNDPKRRVKKVELIFMLETTPPPGMPLPTPQAVPLGFAEYD